jgi:hypothetical protein
VRRVDVKQWVVHDVAALLQVGNPLFRPVLNRVLFDLHHHLPANRGATNPTASPAAPAVSGTAASTQTPGNSRVCPSRSGMRTLPSLK